MENKDIILTIDFEYNFIPLNEIIRYASAQKTYAKHSGQNMWNDKKKQIETDLRILLTAKGFKFGEQLISGRCLFEFHLWRTPSCRWDLDGQSSGVSKVVLDSLQTFGIIKNDNNKTVAGLFFTEKAAKTKGVTIIIKKL